MEPRQKDKAAHQPMEARKGNKKRQLRIVKLEERITPGRTINHNETMVREAPGWSG